MTKFAERMMWKAKLDAVLAEAVLIRRAHPARGKADWASVARIVASNVHDLTRDWPELQKKRAFREAYPFGPRENWPYAAWRIAVAAVQGRKLAPDRRGKSAPVDSTRSIFA